LIIVVTARKAAEERIISTRGLDPEFVRARIQTSCMSPQSPPDLGMKLGEFAPYTADVRPVLRPMIVPYGNSHAR
jgi:hypothetical protein